MSADGRPPPAEHEIDADLVRRLLRAQHPDLADLALTYVTDGWDNVTYRLGDELAVRLPRRAIAAELFAAEQRWLPVLATRVDLAVPEPVRSGEPGEGYPWAWSVVRWVPGSPVDRTPLDAEEAARFGRFLADLHGPAPDGAPLSQYRGLSLRRKHEALVACWDRMAGRGIAVDDVRAAWEEVVDLPIDKPAGWLHGDLHPKNVIGDDGRLVGVIDWGDLCVGDPAGDLAGAWMLFPPEVHDRIWAEYGDLTDATLARARGWAIFFGTVLLDAYGSGEDSFARIGRETLERAVQVQG